MRGIHKNIMAELGRSKYIGWLLNLMVVFMTIGVGILLYWNFAKYEILEPKIGNYQLEKDVYEQGETLRIKFVICKNRDIRERVVGKFIDGVIFSVPDINSNFEPTCYDTYITGVTIPMTLPTGEYIYEEQVFYQVNPIREVSYRFETPRFTVVEKGNL